MATVSPAAKVDAGRSQVAIVKKYANRRLYNTATSSYITLDELCQMVRDGDEFLVYDAKSGDDITRSVLTQIILEEDSKGRNLLPIGFLRQLIRFYDDSLHVFLPRYLELSMENFCNNQDQMRSYFEGAFGRLFPIGHFEDMARQNIALFQRAANMFTPFSKTGEEGQAAQDEAAAPEDRRPESRGEVEELRERVESLQQQLDQLNAPPTPAKRGKPGT